MHCCIPTPTTDSSTSTGMIWVTLNMPSATEECRKTSGKCRGISRCLESGHAEHSEGGIVFNSVCLCVCVCVFLDAVTWTVWETSSWSFYGSKIGPKVWTSSNPMHWRSSVDVYVAIIITINNTATIMTTVHSASSSRMRCCGQPLDVELHDAQSRTYGLKAQVSVIGGVLPDHQ